MFFLFLLNGQSKIKKYNLQDRRYLFQKKKTKTKKKTTKLWLRNRTTRTVKRQDQTEEQWKHRAIQRNSGNTEPYRGTVETQNQAEEQWKHRTIQKNNGNTEPNNRTIETQDQAEEQ